MLYSPTSKSYIFNDYECLDYSLQRTEDVGISILKSEFPIYSIQIDGRIYPNILLLSICRYYQSKTIGKLAWDTYSSYIHSGEESNIKLSTFIELGYLAGAFTFEEIENLLVKKYDSNKNLVAIFLKFNDILNLVDRHLSIPTKLKHQHSSIHEIEFQLKNNKNIDEITKKEILQQYINAKIQKNSSNSSDKLC